MLVVGFGRSTAQAWQPEHKDPAWYTLDSTLKDIEHRRYENMQSKHPSLELDKKLLDECKALKTSEIQYKDLRQKCDSMFNHYKFMYTWR